MIPASKYIQLFVTVAAGTVLAVAVVNFVVDPYGINRVVQVSWLNSSKPGEWEHARLRKPMDLISLHYDGISLGTSQVERGMDPDNPSLTARGITLYNAGLSEERPYEQAILLRLAAEQGHVRLALVCLDFLRYVAAGEFLSRNWTPWRGRMDYLRSLVSLDATRDAAATVWASLRRTPSLQHLPNGLLNVEALFKAIGYPDPYSQFASVDAVFLNGAYQPVLDGRARFERDGFDHAAIRDMLSTARRHGMELQFFVPPLHARQTEIIHLLGLAPLYRQWERELVELLASEAEAAHRSFPLWDFSGYNSVTTEVVPPPGARAPMRWYYDPVHFTSLTGRTIEDRILGFATSEMSGIEDFGIQLTTDNLAAHFAQETTDRRRYLVDRPEVTKILTKLYRGSAPLAAQ
jgi:hypothetical protein